jgi:hypothetical protein
MRAAGDLGTRRGVPVRQQCLIVGGRIVFVVIDPY